MAPPYVFGSRAFNGLNVATLTIYAGLSLMFFLLPFDLDARGLTATQAGLVFLPFTLGVGLLSRVFGGLADRFGPKPMLIAGALTAASGFAFMALLEGGPLWTSVIAPVGLAGLGFALLVAPLTAAVMMSVEDADEGLASGVNNTASRVAQMVGVALAGAFVAGGVADGLWLASGLTVAGAATVAFAVPRAEANAP
ncbi:MAG: MFS transporter [Parvularculaceae bacterium]